MKIPRKGKDLSKKQLLTKLYAYCAYQERSTSEVREKLSQLGVYGEAAKEFENLLISEGFIDDVRYAKVFAGSKFRIKKWGRIKITTALRGKGMDTTTIEEGLKEIEEETYLETLMSLIEKKLEHLNEPSRLKKKKKLLDFATQKGYEFGLVIKVLDDVLANN